MQLYYYVKIKISLYNTFYLSPLLKSLIILWFVTTNTKDWSFSFCENDLYLNNKSHRRLIAVVNLSQRKRKDYFWTRMTPPLIPFQGKVKRRLRMRDWPQILSLEIYSFIYFCVHFKYITYFDINSEIVMCAAHVNIDAPLFTIRFHSNKSMVNWKSTASGKYISCRYPMTISLSTYTLWTRIFFTPTIRWPSGRISTLLLPSFTRVS